MYPAASPMRGYGIPITNNPKQIREGTSISDIKIAEEYRDKTKVIKDINENIVK